MTSSLLIIVPTLNSHYLLPHLVGSLKAQTWPHWQLLFIDGPSGPEHRQWLQQCCREDPRCRWQGQDPSLPGIFGAMNHGFRAARSGDWVLFWGSDDWAASTTVLAEAMGALRGELPDLLVCRRRYAHDWTAAPSRTRAFYPIPLAPCKLSSQLYDGALLKGSTPPHHDTLIGTRTRRNLDRYAEGFRLSADLDYFLQLSRFSDLEVQVLDLELVHMTAGGISGRQTKRRLQEVRRAYRCAFGLFWWFPFLARYLRCTASLLR